MFEVRRESEASSVPKTELDRPQLSTERFYHLGSQVMAYRAVSSASGNGHAAMKDPPELRYVPTQVPYLPLTSVE
ncbi:hypothetical protein KC347_g267 [Hortaea werneckii]|nr:hypothetical protein KC347_g267 [Hortaea werneckii]